MSELPVDGMAKSDQSNLPSVSANDDGENSLWELEGKSVDDCLNS